MVSRDNLEFWEVISDDRILKQGDFFSNVPNFEYNPHELLYITFEYSSTDFKKPEITHDISVVDAILISQSCDLINNKLETVLSCPITTLNVFLSRCLKTQQKVMFNNLKDGKIMGYHLIPGENGLPDDAYVISFRDTFSLPISFYKEYISMKPERKRLKSPELENVSRQFGNYYSRVARQTNLLPGILPSVLSS